MNPLLRVLRRGGSAAVAPTVTGVFKVSANIGGISDYAAEPTFVDMVYACRGFGTVADPLRNTLARPVLNATDRFPAEDFGLVIPMLPLNASAQVLKCKLLGLATITLTSGVGWSVANQSAVGDDTTFDLNVAAGAAVTNAVLTFVSTKRTAASGTNTGCRGIVVKLPGYSIADTTLIVPAFATAMARFHSLRFMDLVGVNNDVATISVADRSSDGKRSVRDVVSVSIEDACRLCNATNCNLWWNIPAAASDALITDYATCVKNNLAVGLSAIFECANENWNSMFQQHNYWLDLAMAMVNGFSFQYQCNLSPKSFSRTANVLTINFPNDHGLTAGTPIYSNVGATVGIQTIVATPTPRSITLADAGADVALTATTASVSSARRIVSAVRAANVTTIVLGVAHGLTGTPTVGVSSVGGLSGLKAVLSIPDAFSLSFTDPGADGNAITNPGGASIVCDLTTTLNNYTDPVVNGALGAWDQFALSRRMYARRTVQMAALIHTAFGAEFGNRAKVGLFNQPGTIQFDQLYYIAQAHGAPNTFIHGVGNASYIFLDATQFGGSNLRNVTTFGGNTPPSKADYAATLALTADGAKTYLKDAYDGHQCWARYYGLKLWQYEFGPDISASPINGAGTAVAQQKIDALFDPLFKPSYRLLLDTMEQHGYEEVCLYAGGAAKVGENNELGCWAIFRTTVADTTSPRVQAIDESMAATRTGPTRNLLAATGTTTISGKQYAGHYDEGAASYGDAEACQFNISAPADGNYNVVCTFTTSIHSEAILNVNGVQMLPKQDIPTGVGDVVWTPILVALMKGSNGIMIDKATLFLGASLVKVKSLAFTPA